MRQSHNSCLMSRHVCRKKKETKEMEKSCSLGESFLAMDGWTMLNAFENKLCGFTHSYGGIQPLILSRCRLIKPFAIEAPRKNWHIRQCKTYSSLFRMSYQRHKMMEQLQKNFIPSWFYISCHLLPFLSAHHTVICKRYSPWTFRSELLWQYVHNHNQQKSIKDKQ